ncbi:MAG: glycoside hydrolase family 127 protein [bacterium]|nr:glycoside hydrolase family 127 protein [bacterium]
MDNFRFLLLTGLVGVIGMGNVAHGAIIVNDKQKPLLPSQVKMSGFLHERMINNEKNWLLKRPEDVLLGGFQRRPGSHPWIGEHVGKWLHASCLARSYTGDAELRKKMDRVVKALLATQEPDGYLGTYTKDERWTSWDVWVHKYCLIGLMSYYEFTGDKGALKGAQGIGDLLIATFGPGKRDIIASGTHVGMAATSVMEPMMYLYNATSDKKYLDFCEYLVKAYDQPNGPKIISSLLEKRSVHETANGKAYEMMSNLVGLCELYRCTGNEKYLRAAEIAWQDIVANRMYITGGTSLGEHFQKEHYLPRTGAVSETCATVTYQQLTLELLRLTGESKYADVVEQIIYNHLLGAQKPTGESFCYFTPLEGKKPYTADICCCTSSGPRGVALIPALAYGIRDDGIAVNLYGHSGVSLNIPSGAKVEILQETDYPFDGKVTLRISAEKAAKFTLYLRIPNWCRAARISGSKGLEFGFPKPGEYARIAGTWDEGKTVILDMDMSPEMIAGEHGDKGLVAMRYGPFVLAADTALNPDIESLNRVAVEYQRTGSGIRAEKRDGTTVFSVPALVMTPLAEKRELKPTSLYLMTFADAGADGSQFRIWLRDKSSLSAADFSPFSFGKESYSREGNVEGMIADGDASSFRVTFDGKPADEDWFAVTLKKPVKVNRVVYAHGRTFHDGGWFDASSGKPKIQILRKPEGEWETIAELNSYPATTATDSAGLRDGQEFSVKFPTVEACGIRILGKPAHGDNPKQSFSSCAELQPFLDK